MAETLHHAKERLLVLDFLRGFFIIVIICDHLWLFPSIWALISGEARLWVTAAEGFVMISGFLIGYIRGLKGMKYPFIDIAKKLFSRATMLYFWMVIVSVGYMLIEWTGNVPRMSYTEMPEQFKEHTPLNALFAAATAHPHAWIHFLYLYAIFLALSVGVVYLFRKGLVWSVVIATIFIYIAGQVMDIEWMKWQLLFFLPSVAGFKFDVIQARWNTWRPEAQARATTWLYMVTGVTLLSSIVVSFTTLAPDSIEDFLGDVFVIEAMSPARVILAGIWFLALAFIFTKIASPINKATKGMIEYFGTHSLTAYIVHGFVICLINMIFTTTIPEWARIPYHSVIGLLTLLLVYAVIRTQLVKRVIPR